MLVGVQFNQNLYAAGFRKLNGQPQKITPPSDHCLADLEQNLKALKPQFVRIFFDPFQDKGNRKIKGTRGSFVETVQLAQRVGATINITVQSVNSWLKSPENEVAEFARLLAELVETLDCTNVRWVTLQNEPNTPGLKHINPPRLKSLYENLAGKLGDLRPQIQFMVGDLIHGADVQNPLKYPPSKSLPSSFNDPGSDWTEFSNQGYWVKWMQDNMDDLANAYSIHIYWDAYLDIAPKHPPKSPQPPPKFATRLDTITRKGKPFYVTEFGVRGCKVPDGKKKFSDWPPGTLDDNNTPIHQSNLCAFQHAWFQIVAAQLGCAGTAKWDAYQATYDASPQYFYVLGESVEKPNTWDPYPAYHLLQLFTTALEPGWQASEVKIPGLESWAEVAEFRGDAGELGFVGLDTRWAMENGISRQQSTYMLATGLRPGTQLALVVWNHGGEGRLSRQPAVTVRADGQASIDIPQQGVFALTTKQLDSA